MGTFSISLRVADDGASVGVPEVGGGKHALFENFD